MAVVEALPEVGRRDLDPEASFVIMASDGLWDVVRACHCLMGSEVCYCSLLVFKWLNDC